MGLLVDLAQPVAHRPHARVDHVLDDGAAACLVALQDAHLAHGPLPGGELLEVGQGVEAGARRRIDLDGLAFAVRGLGVSTLPAARVAQSGSG
jgi:hypothetical protein